MRWPFGRRSTPAEGATSPSADHGRPAAERPHDAWRSLPAVQRVVGDPPVVAPAAPFAETLATRQAPGLALAPLGHEVSRLATPGLVIGVATPAGAANAGRVDLPLQRLAEAAPAEAEAAAWSSFEQGAEGPSDGDAALPSMPAQAQVATIQRLAAPAPILTTAGAAEVSPAPAGRLDLRPGPAAAPPASGHLGETAVVQREAAASPSPVVVPAAQPAVSETPLPARRPTLGEARRLGLGAPLRSPAEMSVQRSGAEPGGPSLPAMPMVPAGVRGAGPASASDGAPGASPAAGSALPASTTGPAERGPGPGAAEALELTVVQPLSIQRLVARTEGRRPIASAASGALPGSHPTAGVDAPASLAIPGGAPAQLPLAVSRLAVDGIGEPARISDEEGVVAQPSWSSPIAGLPIRTSAAGSLLREAARGRVVAPGSPAPAGAAPAGPVVARSVAEASRPGGDPRLPMAAQLAELGITIERGPAGPLAQRAVATPEPSSEAASAAQAGATSVALQRAVEIREVQVTSPGDAAQGGSSPGSGQAATDAMGQPAASSGDRERELDELARRLYGRIRSRLAAELLADRERAGLLVDLR